MRPVRPQSWGRLAWPPCCCCVSLVCAAGEKIKEFPHSAASAASAASTIHLVTFPSISCSSNRLQRAGLSESWTQPRCVQRVGQFEASKQRGTVELYRNFIVIDMTSDLQIVCHRLFVLRKTLFQTTSDTNKQVIKNK